MRVRLFTAAAFSLAMLTSVNEAALLLSSSAGHSHHSQLNQHSSISSSGRPATAQAPTSSSPAPTTKWTMSQIDAYKPSDYRDPVPLREVCSVAQTQSQCLGTSTGSLSPSASDDNKKSTVAAKKP